MHQQYQIGHTVLFQVAIIASDLATAKASNTLAEAQPYLDSIGRQIDVMRKLVVDELDIEPKS